jgi:hypothetical protein
MNGLTIWKRRQSATRRTAPMDCNCVDPWTCNCWRGPISDQLSDGAIQAAEYLETLGFPGIFDRDTCQAMWRRGRRDLSVKCYRYSCGEVAR